MKPENKRPWFSWAPHMPWPAILGLALLFNLNLLTGAAQKIETLEWWQILSLFRHPEFWTTLKEEHFNAHYFPRYAGLIAGLQLNSEVLHMILSMKRNWVKNQESEAKGEAKANAQARAWFEANKDRLPADLPPPPFLEDPPKGS